MSQSNATLDGDTTYRTPRWVKVLGVTVLALIVLMAVFMLATGVQHGPGMHMPPASVTDAGDTSVHTAPVQHGG